MNELADIIISKLEIKQQQWDDEFHSTVQDLYGSESSKEAFVMTEEEALKLAAKTWPKGVKQCTHYSESRRKEQKLIIEKIWRALVKLNTGSLKYSDYDFLSSGARTPFQDKKQEKGIHL